MVPTTADSKPKVEGIKGVLYSLRDELGCVSPRMQLIGYSSPEKNNLVSLRYEAFVVVPNRSHSQMQSPPNTEEKIEKYVRAILAPFIDRIEPTVNIHQFTKRELVGKRRNYDIKQGDKMFDLLFNADLKGKYWSAAEKELRRQVVEAAGGGGISPVRGTRFGIDF